MSFNERQPRQQATFVESKGLVLETNSLQITTNSSKSSSEVTKYFNTDLLKDHVIDIIERENIDQKLLDEINVRFLHYFDVNENISLENRYFNTHVLYTVADFDNSAHFCEKRGRSEALLFRLR